MAKKHLFISFKYSELGWKNDLVNLLKTAEVEVKPFILGEPNKPVTEGEIRRVINGAITSCSGLLLLVGNNAQSTWVEHEVQVASSGQLSYAGTRHPQAFGPLPRPFPAMTELKWDASAIGQWAATLR